MSIAWDSPSTLPRGGAARASGPADADTLVMLAGGGTRASREGRWSTSMTWLAPRLQGHIERSGRSVRLVQVRYADSAFSRIKGCIDDVADVVARERARDNPPRRIILVGLSMGGGVCLANAGAGSVVGLVAMAPWFPEELPIEVLAGRSLLVVHGSLDNAIPFVPGTSLVASRRAVARANAAGASARWVGVRGGMHGLAVRVPGGVAPMPRARVFVDVIAQEVERLAGSCKEL